MLNCKAAIISRLCRSTLRKGFAFPVHLVSELEAMPRESLRGAASQSENQKRSERRSLSAMWCGKAAIKSWLVVVLCTILLALLTGCRRDMQDQPKAIAYRENSFYKDGTGSRPLVEGTVPRGYLREDREMYLGKKSAAAPQTGPIMTQPAGGQPTAPQVRLPTTPVSAASAN